MIKFVFTFNFSLLDGLIRIISVNNYVFTGLLNIDSTLHNSVTIFPNPVRDFLHIQNSNLKTLTIRGYDIWGTLIHLSKSQVKEIVIDMRSLNRGLYNFIVRDEITNQIIRFRVMKL